MALELVCTDYTNTLTKLAMSWGLKWQGSVGCIVELPVDVVWEIVEFKGLSRWDRHAIASSDIVSGDGYSEGSIRCVVFKHAEGHGNGSRGLLYERLLTYDSDQFSYSYALDENPLGYEGYTAAIKLQDFGDGRTFVQWSFQLDPMNDLELEHSITGAIKRSLERRLSSLDTAICSNYRGELS